MLYFTSDPHYGHGNIIRYCQRPFVSLADMNDTMITCHNAVVSPDDTVVMLGDFAFGSADYIASIASRLHGRFILIVGNHDRKLAPLKAAGWDIRQRAHLTLYESLGWDIRQSPDQEIPNPEANVRIFLRHKPDFEIFQPGNTYCDYHFCGHVHTRWKKSEGSRRSDPARERIINVGVDQWGFVPRTFLELTSR